VNADLAKHLDEMADAFANRERAWLPHDRRGRWVVIEPGAGRHLPNLPRHERRLIDRMTPRRGRRFSSLSQARAFARSVGGKVFHWRRTPPGGGVWRRQSPWERALAWPMMMSCAPEIFQFRAEDP
jgi:hypothetical protein